MKAPACGETFVSKLVALAAGGVLHRLPPAVTLWRRRATANIGLCDSVRTFCIQ